MKHSNYSDRQIMNILNQATGGVAIPGLCREHGMNRATFYKWRAKYGGMDASMISRMKELEAENQCLKKMYAEAQLKAEIERLNYELIQIICINFLQQHIR
jgi:putative transposase